MIMNIIPEVIVDKIILYNSTVLCDIYKSSLKINKLMRLFKLGNGKYMRLWHCVQETSLHHDRWARKVDQKIKNRFGVV